MSDTKPSGLFGFTGLTPHTTKGGREIEPGEIVEMGYQHYRDDDREGTWSVGATEADKRDAWNELPESERKRWCANALALVDEVSAKASSLADTLIADAGREMGRALIDATMTEVKLQQRPWDAMTGDQQSEVLERVTSQVRHAVGNALRLLATRGKSHIACELESITVKKAAKLTLTLPRGEVAEDLLESVGQVVLIVIGGTIDADEIQAPQADPDQRALELAKPADAGEDD